MALDQPYIDAIKQSEGYNPQAQWDYKQYTSGYGTKAQAGDENIPADQRQGVYEQRFQDEIGKAASSVDNFAPNLPPGVRAALTSLTYNAGPAWQQSGLGQAIKSGDYDKAKDIFLQYNKAGGEVNPGLVARRQREAAWFTGQPTQTASASPPSAPLVLPSAQQPIFPQQAQAAPMAPQAPQEAAPMPMPVQVPETAFQSSPIQFAQRRPVNLTALRTALQQRAPYFAKG